MCFQVLTFKTMVNVNIFTDYVYYNIYVPNIVENNMVGELRVLYTRIV